MLLPADLSDSSMPTPTVATGRCAAITRVSAEAKSLTASIADNLAINLPGSRGAFTCFSKYIFTLHKLYHLLYITIILFIKGSSRWLLLYEIRTGNVRKWTKPTGSSRVLLKIIAPLINISYLGIRVFSD